MTPVVAAQLEVLRRIADRGVKLAAINESTHYTDLFQHLLDELERLKKELDV